MNINLSGWAGPEHYHSTLREGCDVVVPKTALKVSHHLSAVTNTVAHIILFRLNSFRIKSWLALVLVLVTVILIAISHILEYDIICYEGYGEDVHENVLGICSDDEMAFVTHSKLRSNG